MWDCSVWIWRFKKHSDLPCLGGLHVLMFANEMLCEIKIKIVRELISPPEKSLFLLCIEALVGVGKVNSFGAIDKEHLCAHLPLGCYW